MDMLTPGVAQEEEEEEEEEVDPRIGGRWRKDATLDSRSATAISKRKA